MVQVCLDTASFEVVQNCWQTLLSILKEGLVDLLLCNEAEALAVAQVVIPLCTFCMCLSRSDKMVCCIPDPGALKASAQVHNWLESTLQAATNLDHK